MCFVNSFFDAFVTERDKGCSECWSRSVLLFWGCCINLWARRVPEGEHSNQRERTRHTRNTRGSSCTNVVGFLHFVQMSLLADTWCRQPISEMKNIQLINLKYSTWCRAFYNIQVHWSLVMFSATSPLSSFPPFFLSFFLSSFLFLLFIFFGEKGLYPKRHLFHISPGPRLL